MKVNSYWYPLSIDFLIERLDELTWGFRLEKLQERECTTTWRIMYVNPKTGVWHEYSNSKLEITLKGAIRRLEGNE